MRRRKFLEIAGRLGRVTTASVTNSLYVLGKGPCGLPALAYYWFKLYKSKIKSAVLGNSGTEPT